MSWLEKRVACPFCFERFPIRTMEFRCLTPSCPKERDEKLAKFQPSSASEPRGKVLPAPSGWWASAKVTCCGVCKKETDVRICPHCHNEPPPTFLHQTDLETIGLIGGRGSGKSHYIGVLLHDLGRIAAESGPGYTCIPLGGTWKAWEDHYASIYKNLTTLDGTESAEVNDWVRSPLMLELKPLNRRWGRTRSPVVLSLLDAAGEDLRELDSMRVQGRYITRCAGLVLTIDPLRQPSIRERLEGDAAACASNDDPYPLLARVIELFRAAGVSPRQKILTPLAVAFTKFDALRGVVDGPFLRPPGHRSGFNVADSNRVHEALGAHARAWLGQPFYDALTGNFESFRFFAVSALGSPPRAKTRLSQGITPFRIEDPIFWHLHRLGYLEGRAP